MIKVAIWGAETDSAGELIRILLLHPEVELMSVASESLQGKTIQSRHYGLTGERELRFAGNSDLKNIEMLFVAGKVDKELLLSLPLNYPELRIVDLTDGVDFPLRNHELTAPGLSEIFRKNLVRGARYSYILPPVASLVLIALFPLAKNLLLNKEIRIRMECPESLQSTEEIERSERVISEVLGSIQQSFEEKIEFEYLPIKDKRGMRMSCTLKCGVSLEEVKGLYEGIYDDHNFAFLDDGTIHLHDVSGTQKCLIKLSKPEADILRVEAVADPLMRGGAGDAIHVMNLLLGLYEKIGLTFRAI